MFSAFLAQATQPTPPPSFTTGTTWGDQIIAVMVAISVILTAYYTLVHPKLLDLITKARELAAAAQAKADSNQTSLVEHSKDIRSLNSQTTEIAKAVPTPEVLTSLTAATQTLREVTDTLKGHQS